MNSNYKTRKLSILVEETLRGLSPIQTIMKMTEEQNIKKMGLNPQDVISFGGGWCNHTAPKTLQEIYHHIILDNALFHQSGRYSAITGDLYCREQICELEQKIYQVKSLESDNILLGQSSTQLFHDILRALCNPGEPVGFLDPTYANYPNAVKCALPRSPLQFIDALDTETWSYLSNPLSSLEQLEEFCKQGLRVFVIPVPDNPTSQIPSDNFMKKALDILQQYNGFLILDFAYKALWFETMPRCFSWSVQKHPHLICIHSNSKWLSSLGRRLGWIEADTKVIQALEKINESTLLSPDTLHSMATAEFLKQTLADGSLKTFIDQTRHLYKKTAKVMIQAIDSQLGWKRLIPQGGLYSCCPTPQQQEPQIFATDLLQQTGVLLIPGTGFGSSMEYALRLSYGPLCYDHEKIKEGIERISRYLQQ
ncbi:MAG: pyridoxal phosphate-dependent aminotransferase [Thermoplasmatota archaeon]